MQRSHADYDSIVTSIKASIAAVDAAHASLQAAEASSRMADKDASRQERLHEEDPGAISVRRLEIAQSTREEDLAKVEITTPSCAAPVPL